MQSDKGGQTVPVRGKAGGNIIPGRFPLRSGWHSIAIFFHATALHDFECHIQYNRMGFLSREKTCRKAEFLWDQACKTLSV
jgi:hypothetical protein